MRFEEFLEKQFGLRVSHGISEEEFAKFAPQEQLTVSAEEPKAELAA